MFELLYLMLIWLIMFFLLLMFLLNLFLIMSLIWMFFSLLCFGFWSLKWFRDDDSWFIKTFTLYCRGQWFNSLLLISICFVANSCPSCYYEPLFITLHVSDFVVVLSDWCLSIMIVMLLLIGALLFWDSIEILNAFIIYLYFL